MKVYMEANMMRKRDRVMKYEKDHKSEGKEGE